MQLVDGTDRLDDVRELIREYTEWLGRDLAFQDLEQELADVGRKYLPPEGRVVVAVDDGGSAVGCVAYHRLDGETAEMKRLFVRPSGRGQHLGERLARRIMALAREDGCTRMVLDTVRPLEAAVALYRKLGFAEAEPYYHNPFDDVIYFEKSLEEPMVEVRPYKEADVSAMLDIWNEVVRDGVAFPQEDELGSADGAAFFTGQSACGVAAEGGQVLGMYILHPNNVGRCGHIANASYAVGSAARGRHVGRALVLDSLAQAKELGFRIMQFNAVVAENAPARHLYESLGFTQLGTIPGGFRMPDGSYADICPYYRELD